MEEIKTRWMIRRDMSEVLEIEGRSFEFPWTEEEFLICLRERANIGTVIESQRSGIIFGYMIYALREGHFEILTFAVAPEIRRTGIGSQMMERMKGRTNKLRPRVVVTISENNVAGQLLMRKSGFRATRIMRKHFQNGDDAYWFEYDERQTEVTRRIMDEENS